MAASNNHLKAPNSPLKLEKTVSSTVPYDVMPVFEGVEHLSLHGGFDEIGRLVIIPVFAGLYLKAASAGTYAKLASMLVSSPLLQDVMERVGIRFSSIESVKFTYPGFNGGTPLPNPQVIDRLLALPLPDKMCRTGLKRVEQSLRKTNWYRYQSPAFIVNEIKRDELERLRDHANIVPGLISPFFLAAIDAVLALHLMIDRSEQERRHVVVTCDECAAGLESPRWYGSVQHLLTSCKPSWKSYIRDMRRDGDILMQMVASGTDRIRSKRFDSFIKVLKSDGALGAWATVADVGYEGLRRFRELIKPGSHTITTASGAGGYGLAAYAKYGKAYDHRKSAVEYACSNLEWPTAALSLLWNILIYRALARDFYDESNGELDKQLGAFHRRFAADSILQSLTELAPSRPQLEGGALIIKRESGNDEVVIHDLSNGASATNIQTGDLMLRVEPAIPKPHFAAGGMSAKAYKEQKTLSDRYLLASHLISSDSSDGVTTAERSAACYLDPKERIFWPQGRLWQIVDLVLSMTSHPAWLLCPEVMHQGYIQVSNARWAHAEIKVSPNVNQYCTLVSWRTVTDWCAGAAPSLPVSMGFNHALKYHRGDKPEWPMSIIDAGIGAFDVRIAVAYEPERASKSGLTLASLLHLVRSLATTPVHDRKLEIESTLQRLGETLYFEARPFFTVDGRKITEDEWFGAVTVKNGYFQLACGILIPKTTYDAMTEQYLLRQRVYAKFKRFSLAQIWKVHQDSLKESIARLAPDDYLRQLSLNITPVLRELDDQVLEPLATELMAERLPDLAQIVRPYQATGITWAFLRFKLGLGVCLADEMGLGKTLQAIALLRILRCPGKPSLVVMPKTLLHNWRRELDRFGGGLRFGFYPEHEPSDDFDLLLVTYPRLRIDAQRLTQFAWNVVVIDEAQAIKNSDSQTAQAVGKLQADCRIALTGTPVENRAAELWSLINWLNPGYLGFQGDFSSYTALARSAPQKRLLLAPLRECLGPIILRRTKSDPRVQLDLPDKVFLNQYYELSEEQIMLYESVIESVIAHESLGLSTFVQRAMYLRAILYLKQICIHPELFYGQQDETEVIAAIDEAAGSLRARIRKSIETRMRGIFMRKSAGEDMDGWLSRSGKLTSLQDLMGAWRVQSRGILVFTQYIGAAQMILRMLTANRNVQQAAPLFLHGGLSSAERARIVDDFNDSCMAPRGDALCPVMILSLRAGGTGVNLIGADRVVHLDRWWNPAVEDQATDRVHRIGQKRTVFVHTLTGEFTIEKAIEQIFTEKRSLAADLLGAACADDLGSMLGESRGFLSLADPVQFFSGRLASSQDNSNTTTSNRNGIS